MQVLRALTLAIPLALAVTSASAQDKIKVAIGQIDAWANQIPTLDWQKVIDYNLERMASHGIRRAEEMEQVAATLRELGVAPLMTEAIVARQREMGELGKADAVRAAKREGGPAMLEAIEKAAKS